MNFLLPGVLVLTTIFGAIVTGIGLSEDLSKGIVGRLRSLPIARSAVLVGRTLSNLVRNVGSVILMLGVGFLVRGDDRARGRRAALPTRPCDMPVGWSCRTGVCHSCECGLVDGAVSYRPEPLELPELGRRADLLQPAGLRRGARALTDGSRRSGRRAGGTCSRMCVSPEADFLAAGALLPVGVAGLRTITRREQVILGSLPLLFAAHQFVEGFVWLGLQGEVSTGLEDAATRAYLLFAQVLLPVLVPMGILLTEPDRARRRRMAPLLLLGVAVGGRLLGILAATPVHAHALDHVIVYDTDARFGYVVATSYILATCGPALLSTQRRLRWFGTANIAGLAVATVVRYSAVTSIWCLYAALVSGLILVYLRTPEQLPGSGVGCPASRGRMRLGSPRRQHS